MRQDLLLLVGRVALGAIFVESGLGKLVSLAGFTAGMEQMGLPLASVLAPVGAIVEFLGGLAVVLGIWTPLAALAMVAFTVAATLIAHRFWDVPEVEQRCKASNS